MQKNLLDYGFKSLEVKYFCLLSKMERKWEVTEK